MRKLKDTVSLKTEKEEVYKQFCESKMRIVFEIIGIMLKTVWMTLSGIAETICQCLHEIMQLKQIVGYFTPMGIMALWLGVPTVIVSVAFFLIKRLLKNKV